MAPRNYGEQAQAKAEIHLRACEDALEDMSNDSPAIAPYCGCDTCIVREVLYVVWEVLDAYIANALGN